MLEVWLVRHGKTAGNLLGRYIGTTDEPLCPEGAAALREKSCEAPEVVYASPMKRCLETAGILWPNVSVVQEEDLRECDFGSFENKSYRELNGDPDYQAWIDSNGTLAFPGGESPEEFKARVQRAFSGILEDAGRKGYRRIALAVHGGTIMAIMEKWGNPPGEYYRWQVKNGGGYVLRFEMRRCTCRNIGE